MTWKSLPGLSSINYHTGPAPGAHHKVSMDRLLLLGCAFALAVFFLALECDVEAQPSNGTCQPPGVLALHAGKIYCHLGTNSWGNCKPPKTCISCSAPSAPTIKTCWYDPVLGTGTCVKLVPAGDWYWPPDPDGHCRYCDGGELVCAQGTGYTDALTDHSGGCTKVYGKVFTGAPVGSCPVN